MTERSAGSRRMWELTQSFPAQLETGFQTGTQQEVSWDDPSLVGLLGMGGSGLAGDLFAAVTAELSDRPVLAFRDPRLPRWLGRSTSLVLVSYSGDTQEVLEAYQEARRRSMAVAVVTSGGTLGRWAARDSIPMARVPGGQPPRASLGLIFGALWGLLPGLHAGSRSLANVVEELRTRTAGLSSDEGPPARLARAWEGRELWTYAPEPFACVARRWKDDAEENAKELSHFDTLPELAHNAIVAWDVLTEGERDRRLVALLEGPDTGAPGAWESRYLEGELNARGIRTARVRPQARDTLGSLLELAWFGDFLSLFRADAKGVDPLPMEGIVKMKTARKRVGGAAQK
jgi:glucose/mannose-6-phosphate isomerase